MKKIKEYKELVIVVLVILGIFIYINQKNNTDQKQENTTFSKSSKEYATMARQAWIAFSCSYLASQIGNGEEQKRLFTFGYEQGKEFLGAVRAQKIEQKDFQEEVPIGVSFLLEGPDNEFILGRIYASVEEDASEKLLWENYDRSKINSTEIIKSKAENEFQNANCQLIGK